MPAISVILPIYNVEKYLRQCLDSILSQSFKDIELICINDKSPDNSSEILKIYAAKDSRIRVINNNKNVGVGVSRNIGIKHAKGKYLMMIDSDDWYEPEAFELLYNQIEKNQNDFVIFNYRKYFEKDSSFEYPTKYMSGYIDELDNPDIKLWELDKPFIISAYVWTQIYNAEFIKKNDIKFDNWFMGEDARFYFNSIIASNSISVINKPLINYRIHNESISHSRFELLQYHLKSRLNAYKIILKSRHKTEYLRSYIPYSIRSILYYYKNLDSCNISIKKNYYNKMQEFFIELNNNYDIKKYKDEINYKFFSNIIKNPFNEKSHQYFEIPSIISIKRTLYGKIIIKFLFIKITI